MSIVMCIQPETQPQHIAPDNNLQSPLELQPNATPQPFDSPKKIFGRPQRVEGTRKMAQSMIVLILIVRGELFSSGSTIFFVFSNRPREIRCQFPFRFKEDTRCYAKYRSCSSVAQGYLLNHCVYHYLSKALCRLLLNIPTMRRPSQGSILAYSLTAGPEEEEHRRDEEDDTK